MDAIEAILTRRSIRKYKSKPIPEDVVAEVLKAAMHAPTAGNQRPWHFMIVTNHDLIDQIPVIHPYAEMVRIAPMVILVCGDLRLEKHVGYWEHDCSAATLTMGLAAHALGLGACWLGIHPREDRVAGIREIFDLPKNVIPFSIVALGYPDETPEEMNRYMPDRIHYEKW